MRRLAGVTDVSVTRIRGRDRLGKRNRLRVEAIQRGEIAPIAPKGEVKRVERQLSPPPLTLQSLGLLGAGSVGRKRRPGPTNPY